LIYGTKSTKFFTLKAIFENDCTRNVMRYASLTHPTGATHLKWWNRCRLGWRM